MINALLHVLQEHTDTIHTCTNDEAHTYKQAIHLSMITSMQKHDLLAKHVYRAL